MPRLNIKHVAERCKKKVVLSNEMCTVNTTSQKYKSDNNKMKHLIYNNS